MLIRRFAGLSGKPLLIEVLPTVTETELAANLGRGCQRVIVKTDAEQAEAVTANLRKIIEKLTFPSKRKNEKTWRLYRWCERDRRTKRR